MTKNIFLLLFLLLLWRTSSAQTDLPIWSQKHPDENAVYLKDEETIIIKVNKGKLDIRQEVYHEVLYLNDNAHFLSNGRVYYSHFSPILELEAQTLVPQENDRYKTIQVSDFKDVGETSENIFYDDSRSKSFMYPALTKGAKTILSYKKNLTEPHLLSSFFFGSSYPAAEAKLVIRAQKGVKIKYNIYHGDQLPIDYTTKEKGDFVDHIWTAKDVKKFEGEAGAVPARYYIPHIVYYIESYTVNGVETPVLRNLSDLHNWDYSFVKSTINEDSPELKKLTDSIISGAATDKEKAKRIYYWVQDHVKYVAFEDGLRGFTPYSPYTVCNNRYGDCKDMASLLNGMLRYAGLNSHLVWIGSRSLPYKFTELPTPGVANHMITAVQLEDTLIYLDATSRFTPFGIPSAFIMGKEALFEMGESSYKIRTVPVMSKELSASVDSASFRITGKMIHGTGKLTLSGYKKARNTYGLDGNRKEDVDKAVHNLLQKGSNKYKTSKYTLHNIRDKDHPLEVNYEFTVEDYVTIADNEMYVNILLDKYFSNATIDTSKFSLPRENDFHVSYTTVNTVEIPEGYEVNYVPKDSEYKGDLFGYTIRYAQTGKAVTAVCSIHLSYLILDKEKFPEWNNMIKKLKSNYKEAVVLKKI